jgi:hypothetical protein
MSAIHMSAVQVSSIDMSAIHTFFISTSVWEMVGLIVKVGVISRIGAVAA